jgi:hypothetical protein
MPSVLLIGNPLAAPEEIQKKHEILSKDSSVAFEQLDRVPVVALKKVDFIESGSIEPQQFNHSPQVIAQFSKALLPNGKLHLVEPCVVDSGVALQLEKYKNPRLPFHTERSLQSDLIINGFVDIHLETSAPVGDEQVALWIEGWGVDKEAFNVLKGNVVLVTAKAKKPNYEQSTGAKLSFRKKQEQQKPVQQKVWTISANDDDDELENEDELLDEEDLVVPPTAAPGDCSTRKKACKDCSCGRAEEEAKELVASITVVPKKTVTSSCGSVLFF